jgi:hypothetical protein
VEYGAQQFGYCSTGDLALTFGLESQPGVLEVDGLRGGNSRMCRRTSSSPR